MPLSVKSTHFLFGWSWKLHSGPEAIEWSKSTMSPQKHWLICCLMWAMLSIKSWHLLINAYYIWSTRLDNVLSILKLLYRAALILLDWLSCSHFVQYHASDLTTADQVKLESLFQIAKCICPHAGHNFVQHSIWSKHFYPYDRLMNAAGHSSEKFSQVAVLLLTDQPPPQTS